MAQCIITSFDNRIAVYFNDIIRQAEIEITDMKRNVLVNKRYFNADHFILRQDNITNGFVDVRIRTGNEMFKKRIFINNKKVKS